MAKTVYHIDFNAFRAGTVSDDALRAQGLHISADGDAAHGGGRLTIGFEGPARVTGLRLLDVDEGASILLLDRDGNLLAAREVAPAGDGARVDEVFDVEGVHWMRVTLNGAGAVDELSYALGSGPDLAVPELDQTQLVAEYLFEDDNQGQQPIAARTFEDSATARDGVAQTGAVLGSANTINARDTLDLDGRDDAVLIAADDAFQIGQGAVSLEFTQAPGNTGPQTLISRDSRGFDEGGHLTLQVTDAGQVTVRHQTEDASFTYATQAGFFAPGETVRVYYQWDDGGVEGRFIVENTSTQAVYQEAIREPLTLDMGPRFNEPWTIGASQAQSSDNAADALRDHLDGEIDTVRIYDLSAPGPALDGIVEGTGGADRINLAYTGDPDGDRVDNGDAILPGEGPDDDIILGFGGNDTIRAGAGDDAAFGGAGRDVLRGQDGDDLLDGGAAADRIFGGDGNDTLVGGTGADRLRGGDDRDVFRAAQDDAGTPVDAAAGSFIGDRVDGGAGGDDFDVLDLRGTAPEGGRLQVTETGPDSNGNGVNGFVEYFDETDTSLGRLRFQEIEDIIVCFTPGAAIATPHGEVAVETLRPGDRVITRDNGLQEIAWTGARQLTRAELMQAAALRPVRIRAGAFGENLPERDMIVSPQHRVLMASDRTQLYFDEREVLVAAKHLVGMAGVTRMGAVPTRYIHFMCASHEVVLSDGAWTETFQPGDYTLGSMGAAARGEILTLFPELSTAAGLRGYTAARKSLKRHEAAILAAG